MKRLSVSWLKNERNVIALMKTQEIPYIIRIIIFLIFIIVILLSTTIYSADKTITVNDSISIYVKEDSIDYKKFFKNYEEVKYLGWISFVYNQPIYGIDDEPPNTIFSELILINNNLKINLDVSYMSTPHFPQLDKNKIKLIIKDDLIMLTMAFSDGAGAYAAQWLIFGNRSTRTIISSNEGIKEWMFR